MNLFDGRAPQHIGYLVEDVDRVHSRLSSTPGVRVSAPREAPVNVDVGEPATLRLLLAQVGESLLEFTEPAGGYWLETLRKQGPGVHHVAYAQFGDEFDEAVETAKSLGFTVPVAGHVGQMSRWAYIEADGLVFELASGLGPSLEPREPR